MVAPEPSEPLLLYIRASTDAVRMVLVMEQPEPQQHQVPEAKEAPGSQTQEPPILDTLPRGQYRHRALAPGSQSRPQQPKDHRVPAPGGPFWTLGPRSLSQ
jgi:hypothetical protein